MVNDANDGYLSKGKVCAKVVGEKDLAIVCDGICKR